MATDYDSPRKTDEELHEESLEELKEYQDEGTNNPAVLTECWTGGRLLHWLPYSTDAENKELIN